MSTEEIRAMIYGAILYPDGDRFCSQAELKQAFKTTDRIIKKLTEKGVNFGEVK